MKKLILFIAIVGGILYFVLPKEFQLQEIAEQTSEIISTKKTGFEKYKEDVTKEFEDFKSKN